MALTRKFLSALGIEADKIDEIISAHTETVDGLKEQIANYKADAEKLPTVQKELDDLKKAAEGQDGKNPFEVKYNAIKEEFENYKKDIEQKESKSKIEAAYKALLKEAGVSEKRIDAVLKVSDLEKVKLDKDGKIEGADELKKSIETEWEDFIVKEEVAGANTAKPPKTNNGSKKTKAEIMAITDRTERRKAMMENPEVFGLAPNT